VSFKTVRLIYFAYVQSIVSYGIILWDGSSHAKKMFILQKKIRLIMNTKPKRESCREIFKKLEIMMPYSQYIYSLLLYVINNGNIFTFNNEIHKHISRSPLSYCSFFIHHPLETDGIIFLKIIVPYDMTLKDAG
jgi:hypothetical protein